MGERVFDSGRRTALVTGGTAGIGRAVALELARRQLRVVIVGRDRCRGAEVLAHLRTAHPDAGHEFIAADLSLLTETARVLDGLDPGVGARLDALVLCAGVLSVIPEWTTEDLERTFVLNYLSRFLMIKKLLPALKAAPSGRIVLVANAGRYPDTLDLGDLQMRQGVRGLTVAGRTQFANDLLAVELAERLRDTNIHVSCVYPGLVATDVFRNAHGLPAAIRVLARAAQRLFAISPAVAARTPVFLADDPQPDGRGVGFLGPRCRPRPIPARVRRPDRRAALWAASEDLVRPWLGSTARVPATSEGDSHA